MQISKEYSRNVFHSDDQCTMNFVYRLHLKKNFPQLSNRCTWFLKEKQTQVSELYDITPCSFPTSSLHYLFLLDLLVSLKDPCYQVRYGFAQKLHKGLILLRLPLQYMSIFCLAANDPHKERRQQVKQFLQSNITKRREYLKTNNTAGSKYKPLSIPWCLMILNGNGWNIAMPA